VPAFGAAWKTPEVLLRFGFVIPLVSFLEGADEFKVNDALSRGLRRLR
jgi:hypothetical protein